MGRSALILFIAGLLQPTTAFSRALIVPHRTVHVPLISSPTASSIAANPIKTSTATLRPRLNLCRAARVAIATAATTLGTVSLALAGTVPKAYGANSFGAVSMAARFAYSVKQAVITQAGLAVFVFAIGVIILGGILYKLVSKDSIADGSWRAYTLLNNVPGADATADETGIGKFVSNTIYMVGVLTFAVVIGIISDRVSSGVEGIRVSNERVQEVGHTVVVNWGPSTRPLLRQLENARREGRIGGPVVILSEKEKEEMDAEVAAELKAGSSGLSVITRHGSPSELANMDRVASGTARRIIVLPQGDEEDGDAQQTKSEQATGLALALQRGVTRKVEDRASVVVTAPKGAMVSAAGTEKEDGFKSYAEVSVQQPHAHSTHTQRVASTQPADTSISLSHTHR